MIDQDFAALKEWVSRNMQSADLAGQALLNFLNSLEMEASTDRELAVLLRRVSAAAFDDAQRKEHGS